MKQCVSCTCHYVFHLHETPALPQHPPKRYADRPMKLPYIVMQEVITPTYQSNNSLGLYLDKKERIYRSPDRHSRFFSTFAGKRLKTKLRLWQRKHF